MVKKKILAISGSTRKNSTNESILLYLKEKYINQVDLEIYKCLSDLPHFNPDLAFEHTPDIVINFRKKIKNADAVVICTPEYVFSLPGSLKNAIEWTVGSTVFSEKPTGIIVASGLGEKAFDSLLLIMKTIEARISESSSILISGARAIVTDTGQITDKIIIERLHILIEVLLAN